MSGPHTDSAALRSRAASGARWMSLGTGVRVLSQLAQLAALGRLLAPEEFGLMALVLVIVALGQAMGDAGVSNAIIHHQDATRRELSSLYWLNVLAGGVVFVVVWLTAPLVAVLFEEPRLISLLRWGSLVFLVAPLGQQFQVLLERDLRFRRVAAIESAASIFALAVGVTTALRGAGAHALVWAMLAASVAKTIGLVASGVFLWRPQVRLVWGECRRFLGFGAFQMGERILNQGSAQLDKLLIGVLFGSTPLGFYSVSQNLATRPYQTLSPTVTRVAFPVFSRIQRDDARLRAGFLQLVEAISVVMFPIYVMIGVLSEPLVGVVLGDRWGPSVPLLRILACMGVLLSLGNPMGSLLLAKGRPRLAFGLNGLRLVLDAVAIVLVAGLDIRAVALALLFVRAVIMFPLGFWIRWRLVGMRPAPYLRAFLPFASFSLIVGVAVATLVRFVTWPGSAVELGVGAALGVSGYGALLWAFERKRLLRILTLVRS